MTVEKKVLSITAAEGKVTVYCQEVLVRDDKTDKTVTPIGVPWMCSISAIDPNPLAYEELEKHCTESDLMKIKAVVTTMGGTA